MKTLLLGGVKSGKSRFAEELAIASDRPVLLIATAQANDEEMEQRIAQHQQNRPADWQVVEEPLNLASVMPTNDNHEFINRKSEASYVIVDCLTLWITQLLCSKLSEDEIQKAITDFTISVEHFSGDLVLVSNETNMGIIPMDALSRKYCDLIGRLHQTLASQVDQVTLMVAGLPMNLK